MGGIIAGFIGGAGKGAAIAGQMQFKKNLEEELNEANFLRRSALRREMVGEEINARATEIIIDLIRANCFNCNLMFNMVNIFMCPLS